MTTESNSQSSDQQPSNDQNNQPAKSEPSNLFSFDNKENHTTTVTLEDFSGGGGHLLVENKK